VTGVTVIFGMGPILSGNHLLEAAPTVDAIMYYSLGYSRDLSKAP
jgi:hypothetical protein